MKSSTPSKLTEGQETKYRRLVEDSAKHATNLALSKTEADQDGWQRVLERGDDLKAAIAEVVVTQTRDLSVSNRYADQVVKSNYTYPPEYRGPKPIKTQVKTLLTHFPRLNAEWVLTNGQAWYDGIKPNLPTWIEGPLVYIWWEVFDDYNAALQQVLDRIAATWTFSNYRAGAIDPDHLRQLERTARMERALKALQPGDLIIVPNQAGVRHRGESVLRAREVFVKQEFGLGGVAEGCRALTHPERYVRWEQLHTDLAGDEYSPGADGGFSGAPCLCFDVGGVGFNTDLVSDPGGSFGSSSALLPQ